MHEDQLTILPETVRELVDECFPEWRRLPIEAIASQGTVNALFRIGEDIAARFPLQPTDPDETRRTLEREAAAAEELFGRTRFRTPRPLGLGEPGHGYPLPWSVQTWIPGRIATPESEADSVSFARDLADLIRDVRAIDTRGRTFGGSGRGGDIKAHDAWMETCFAQSEHLQLLDVPRLRRMWTQLRELPRESPDVMTHGDLIPGNLLVAQGRLAGVLDVGGFGPADPALELVCAWHLLEAEPRQLLRKVLGCDALEWRRGKAWALEQAMGVVWYYRESNPPMAHMGEVTLRRLLEDSED
jgi:aminoglycoside phosphotransferase (APT) family kinase protein